MRKLLAVAMFFGLSVEGTALGPSPLIILGAGKDSCGTFTKAEGATKDLMMSWILGYITAASFADYVQGRKRLIVREVVLPELTLRMWLENYCTANQLSNLSDAALQLVIELPRATIAP